MKGLAVRLCMLQTHYRKPKNWLTNDLNVAAKTIRRWLAVAVPGGAVTVEVLEALCDDLNTPQAIAELHKLANQKRSAELFAGMLLLGLVPNPE